MTRATYSCSSTPHAVRAGRCCLVCSVCGRTWLTGSSSSPADLRTSIVICSPASPRIGSLIDVDDTLMIQYGVLATPSAVVLSAAGARVEALVVGPTAIESLASHSADDRAALVVRWQIRSPLSKRGGRASDRVLSPRTSPLASGVQP